MFRLIAIIGALFALAANSAYSQIISSKLRSGKADPNARG
jgi:hypothetical protein